MTLNSQDDGLRLPGKHKVYKLRNHRLVIILSYYESFRTPIYPQLYYLDLTLRVIIIIIDPK